MSYLKITNLKKSYGSHQILKGINFEAEKGDFVCLLGPSGCGKTTTLRCVAGLERPDQDEAGRIQLGDETLSGGTDFTPPELRNFGMVFQNYAVWPHMNVFENVAFPLKMKKNLNLDRRHLIAAVLGALEKVKLGGLEYRFGHELSGGQQQRVALARALVMSPRLLLLDEPLSNLDVLLREELRTELARLHKELGLTTILVTHDQKEALSLATKIILLDRGEIVDSGTPEYLFSTSKNFFTTEFLAQGQKLTRVTGQIDVIVPRKWVLKETGSQATIVSRLYLGHEYEYWAKTETFVEPIKIFHGKKLDIGSRISVEYQN